MAEYTFTTKEEWQAAYQKLGRYEEIKGAVLDGVGSPFWKLYEKEAGADRFEDGIPKRKKIMEDFLNVAANDLAATPGITELKVLSGVKRQFKITGQKGWISAENAVVASPKNEETKAQAQSIQKVNSTVDPPKEQELKQEYGSLVKNTGGNTLPTAETREKLSTDQKTQIQQSTELGKASEDQRQAQADQDRQAAVQSGLPAPQEEKECPCGASVTDAEKDALNWGRQNPVFQNPMTGLINNTQGGFANTLTKVNSVTALLGTLGGQTSEITTLTNTIGNMQGILTNYQNTSNRLSGLPFTGDGPDLLSLVSTVGAAVNFQCALGIPGLDVGAKVGLMTEDGKLRLNVALGLNVKLSKLLDGLDLGGTSAGIREGLNKITGEINNITGEINKVAGEINGSISEVNGMFNDALDFVTQFTNINFAMNFSNDPCTKFGVGFQQGILNPEFIERARRANPLNAAQNPGFGTAFR